MFPYHKAELASVVGGVNEERNVTPLAVDGSLLGKSLPSPPTMKPSVLPPELSKTVYFTPGRFSAAGLLQ